MVNLSETRTFDEMEKKRNLPIAFDPHFGQSNFPSTLIALPPFSPLSLAALFFSLIQGCSRANTMFALSNSTSVLALLLKSFNESKPFSCGMISLEVNNTVLQRIQAYLRSI